METEVRTQREVAEAIVEKAATTIAELETCLLPVIQSPADREEIAHLLGQLQKSIARVECVPDCSGLNMTAHDLGAVTVAALPEQSYESITAFVVEETAGVLGAESRRQLYGESVTTVLLELATTAYQRQSYESLRQLLRQSGGIDAEKVLSVTRAMGLTETFDSTVILTDRGRMLIQSVSGGTASD